MIQGILVFITFIIAVGYVLNKFIIAPIIEKKKVLPNTLDGGKTKCGSSNCGCH
ncbi:hypothetical protein [Patiriisocius marinus]|uniref:Uncharacterized protein n=1 Tax=Patiriisocius marinus TaxID=1397112 RepID=A0A5J4IZ70_9FLAO|nr:hypothetical protein [Patiriisocius marinus]GER58783.1 hypothetical protein ULMA_08910 [Patiriisocius marinus]